MAIIGKFTQQPSETLDYDMDFSEFLPIDDTITSATVKVQSLADGSEVPYSGFGRSFAVQHQRVKVWCIKPLAGRYKITVLAVTSDCREKENEFTMTVKDD